MKAMYINAPGQVEIKDVEMPVRKEGRSFTEASLRRDLRK